MKPIIWAVASMLLLGPFSLDAQSYQSKFAGEAYDTTKGPSTFHDGVEVEASTGAVNIHLPLGPGIGTRGIHFQPALLGHFAPTLDGRIIGETTSPMQKTVYNPLWTNFSISPGFLDLALSDDSLGDDDGGLVVTNYTLPGGSTGTMNTAVAAPSGVIPSASDLQNLLKAFNYTQSDLGIGLIPYRTDYPTSASFALRDSTGALVLGLQSPSSFPYLSASNCGKQAGNGFPGGNALLDTSPWYYPQVILVVQGDVAYEFSFMGTKYATTVDPDHFITQNVWGTVLRSAHYRLSAIRNRYSEAIQITYPANMGYVARWIQGGQDTGVQVELDNAGNLTYQSPETTVAPSFSVKYASLGNNVPGLAAMATMPDPLNLIQASSVTSIGTSETISFAYTPLSGASCPGWSAATVNGLGNSPAAIGSVQFPTHTLNFTWTCYFYLKPTVIPGDWLGYYASPLTAYTSIYAGAVMAPNWFWGVTEIDDLDLGTNVTYQTFHDRTIPQAHFSTNPTNIHWDQTAFYDVVTHPDSSVTVYRFAEPVQDSMGMGSTSDQMQTLAHLKHLVTETRNYIPGAYSQSDLNAAAANSSAYRINVSDRWDLRDSGNPTSNFLYSSVPYPTRTRSWNRDTRVLQTKERTGFDATNLGWQLDHAQVGLTSSPTLSRPEGSADVLSLDFRGLGPAYPESGAVSNLLYRYTQSTFSSDYRSWFLGRSLQSTTFTSADTTGGLSGSISLPASQPTLTRTFDPAGSQLGRVLTATTSAGSSWVRTTYNFSGTPNTLAAGELPGVNLSGSSDLTLPSGGIGATYQYDAHGFPNVIKPLGVAWSYRQEQDGLNQPQNQWDPNGLRSDFTWDGGGRLLSLAPPDVLATTYAYDPDHLGVTITRGVQKSDYRYSGRGNLVLIKRWDGSNTLSTKSFWYDLEGRKVYESVWHQGAGSLNDGQQEMGQKPGDVYVYDGEGRPVRHTAPTGMVTATTYNGLSKSVTVSTPGKPESETTTYTYDAAGRLINVQDPDQNVTAYAYDGADRISQVTQHAGPLTSSTFQVRTWGYHPLGWLQTLVQPESGTTSYSNFTVSGNPQLTTYVGDGSGSARTVSSTFDSLMRVTNVISGDGTIKQSFIYDRSPAGGRAAADFGAANGKLVYSADKGIELFRTYGGLSGSLSGLDTQIWTGGNPGAGTSTTYPQSYAVDSYGNRVLAACGESTVTTTWDQPKGMPNGVLRNNSNLGSAVIDPITWLVIGHNYANGSTSSYSYDIDLVRLSTMNHLAAGGQGLVNWNFSYDGVGNLLGDGEDSFTYRTMGRLAAATMKRLDPASGLPSSSRLVTQALTYDAFGNVTSSQTTPLPDQTYQGYNTANFALTQSEMDLMARTNRLPATAGGSGKVLGAAYDPQGNLTQINPQVGATDKTLLMAYDALGRVIQMTDESRAGFAEKYYYSTDGLRTMVEEYLNSTLQKRRYSIYNDLRQLVSQYETTSVTQQTKSLVVAPLVVSKEPCGATILSPSSGTHVVAGTTLVFQGTSDYGTQFLWTFGDGTSASTNRSTHAWAAPGTYTVTLKASATGYVTDSDSISIIVDPVGGCGASITSPQAPVLLTAGTPQTFVGSTTLGTSLTWSWGDGTTGSGLTSTHAYPNPGTYTVTFFATAYQTTPSQATLTVQVQGAPVVQAFTTNVYQVMAGQGATLSWTVAGATSLVLNAQTATGALTPQTVTGRTSWTVTPTISTTYTITATNAQGSTVSPALSLEVNGITALAWKRDYVYLGGKEMAEVDANGPHTTLVDHLGSPRMITNASGAVEARQKFLPFGETLDRWNPTGGSLTTGKGFTNHEQTDASGLIYMQARFYLPMYGRFASPDPARDQHFEETQSWNIYSYCQNDPVMRIDPTGLTTFLCTYNTGVKGEDDFKRAAITRANEIAGGKDFDPSKDKVLVMGVGTKADFKDAIKMANTQEKSGFGKVGEIDHFSHAGKIDGPVFHRGDGTEEQFSKGELKSLKINWEDHANAKFFGCRTALNFAQNFADAQGVTTWGYHGKASTSSTSDHYTSLKATGPVYLIDAPAGKENTLIDPGRSFRWLLSGRGFDAAPMERKEPQQ